MISLDSTHLLSSIRCIRGRGQRGQRRKEKEDETWLTADLRAIKSYGREREKICRYILKRDPFRGNYGLIRAFVNQPKEELGRVDHFRFSLSMYVTGLMRYYEYTPLPVLAAFI